MPCSSLATSGSSAWPRRCRARSPTRRASAPSLSTSQNTSRRCAPSAKRIPRSRVCRETGTRARHRRRCIPVRARGRPSRPAATSSPPGLRPRRRLRTASAARRSRRHPRHSPGGLDGPRPRTGWRRAPCVRQRHVCGHAAIFLRAMARVRHVDRSLHVVGNGAATGREPARRPTTPTIVRQCSSPTKRTGDRSGLSSSRTGAPSKRRRPRTGAPLRSARVKFRPARSRNRHGLEIARRDHVQPEERGRLRCGNGIALDVERSLGDGAGERQRVHQGGCSTPPRSSGSDRRARGRTRGIDRADSHERLRRSNPSPSTTCPAGSPDRPRHSDHRLLISRPAAITSSTAHATCAIVSADRTGPATAGRPPRPPESSTRPEPEPQRVRTGREPEGAASQNRDAAGEEERAHSSGARLEQARRIRRQNELQKRQRSPRTDAGDAAERREQDALGQQLARDPPRRRADRGPDADLALTRWPRATGSGSRRSRRQSPAPARRPQSGSAAARRTPPTSASCSGMTAMSGSSPPASATGNARRCATGTGGRPPAPAAIVAPGRRRPTIGM